MAPKTTARIARSTKSWVRHAPSSRAGRARSAPTAATAKPTIARYAPMPIPTKSPAPIAFAIVAFTWLSVRIAAGANSMFGLPPRSPLATKRIANASPTTPAAVAHSRKRASRGSSGRAAERTRKTSATTAASATAQSPMSNPLMPPAFTAASAGVSEDASSAAEKLRCVYVTQGRKNATSASAAARRPTTRARESFMSGPPGRCRAVRGEGRMRNDVGGVGAGRVEGGADRAEDVGEISVEGGHEMPAAREHARVLRAVDLPVDDVHVAVVAERVERPLGADLDAGLAIGRRGAWRGVDLAGGLAVCLAGAAVREEHGHHDVLAGLRGTAEHAFELSEDAVAVAADEGRDVVRLDLEAGLFQSRDRAQDDRHVALGQGAEGEPRAKEGGCLGDRHCSPSAGMNRSGGLQRWRRCRLSALTR